MPDDREHDVIKTKIYFPPPTGRNNSDICNSVERLQVGGRSAGLRLRLVGRSSRMGSRIDEPQGRECEGESCSPAPQCLQGKMGDRQDTRIEAGTQLPETMAEQKADAPHKAAIPSQGRPQDQKLYLTHGLSRHPDVPQKTYKGL